MKARSLTIGVAMAAAAALSAAAPAAAEDDLFTQVFSAIGLVTPERDPIEYRERAPLVVPPKTQLPAPQAPTGQRNSAWPNDPDVVARRQAGADRNAPVPNQLRGDSTTMTPAQLRAGPRTATNAYQGRPLGARLENDNNEMMIGPARQMRAIDAQREVSLNNLRPGEEPERKALSDPPTGYRKPTELVRAKNDPVKTQRDNDTSLFMDFLRGDRRSN